MCASVISCVLLLACFNFTEGFFHSRVIPACPAIKDCIVVGGVVVVVAVVVVATRKTATTTYQYQL